MDTLGVVGLGRMGAPITRRLRAVGFAATVFDIRTDAVEAMRDDGVRIAASGSILASSVDTVVTALPGPGELREAMAGRDGILAAMRAGSCWLDLTSNDPSTAPNRTRVEWRPNEVTGHRPDASTRR